MHRCKDDYHTLYTFLLDHYGPQGWWPLMDIDGRYHPNDFSWPHTSRQRFEIGIGAILTQNTAWAQVEKVLSRLLTQSLMTPRALLSASNAIIKQTIKPAGFFNQKTKKLRLWADFFLQLNNQIPQRDDLLALWGVGPETADSILLYAYHQPVFVIDAYTKRLLAALDWPGAHLSYTQLQQHIQSLLPKDVALYQELHALIVQHVKVVNAIKTA